MIEWHTNFKNNLTKRKIMEMFKKVCANEDSRYLKTMDLHVFWAIFCDNVCLVLNFSIRIEFMTAYWNPPTTMMMTTKMTE